MECGVLGLGRGIPDSGVLTSPRVRTFNSFLGEAELRAPRFFGLGLGRLSPSSVSERPTVVLRSGMEDNSSSEPKLYPFEPLVYR